MPIPLHRLCFIPFLAASIALTACDPGKEMAGETVGGGSIYEAEILRTDYGIAHITAGDYGSLGYGEGYAAAEDHVCNIARGLLEARGELAQVFGPGRTATWRTRAQAPPVGALAPNGCGRRRPRTSWRA